MRIRNKDEDLEEGIINTSSLVDVLFILLIFFIVTMSFNEEEREIEVNLPETDSSLSSASKALIVNVRSDGRYFLGAKQTNLANIQATLRRILDKNPQQKVLIRGDKQAFHGQVAAAIAACKASGIADANIGYISNTN
jgi:biopolymer transport protein ExbD